MIICDEQKELTTTEEKVTKSWSAIRARMFFLLDLQSKSR